MNEQQRPEETIRQWYDRTTKKARAGLMWCCAASIIGAACFFAFAPLKLAQFMQTANGAVTIPIAGGIWIAAFVYIFLVPSREVGFRSQESIEQTQQILADAVEKKIKPALDVWLRIGARVESELNNGLMDQIKGTIKDLRESTLKVTSSAENSNGEIKKFTDDAKPAIEALKNLHDKIDRNLGGDFVENLKMAVESVKQMSLPPMDPGMPVLQAKEPKIDKALSMLSKPKPKSVIPPPPLATPAETPAPVPAAAPASSPVVMPGGSVALAATPSVLTAGPVPSAAPVVVPTAAVVAPVPPPVPVTPPVAVVPAPSVVPASPIPVASPVPVMVPTPAIPIVQPVVTQPVLQAPVLTPTSPASRFNPAPPPSPVIQGMGAPAPAAMGAVPMGSGPVKVVLAPDPQRQIPPPPQRTVPELSGSRPTKRGPRPGEVELPLNQMSRPVVVTPVAPQQMGVPVQSGPVPMIMAPQVIQRAEG